MDGYEAAAVPRPLANKEEISEGSSSNCIFFAASLLRFCCITHGLRDTWDTHTEDAHTNIQARARIMYYSTYNHGQ